MQVKGGTLPARSLSLTHFRLRPMAGCVARRRSTKSPSRSVKKTSLEVDIVAIEQEKVRIEDALCSCTISVDDITAMTKRLPLLNDELDE